MKRKLFDDADSDYENDEKAAEASDDDVMDEAAKTETEDKVSENTGDEPKISADENQHIKQQTKLTHKKTYKKPHKKQFKEKSEKIKTGIGKLKREYGDERNKAAFSHLKKELFIILKRICPRRLKLTMVYSTGSPDTTGISLGILACFPVGYTNRWRIMVPPQKESKEY